MKTTIKELVQRKGLKAQTQISPQLTVADGLRKMSELNVGALLVVENDQVRGVFSERDYARKILLHGKSSLLTPIKDVMSTSVVYVTTDYTLDACLAIMNHMNIRHLPVLENKQIISFLSIKDISQKLIEDQGFYIEELLKYITGSTILSENDPKPMEALPLIKTILSKDYPSLLDDGSSERNSITAANDSLNQNS